MKRLSLLCLAYFISVSPMHLVLRQSTRLPRIPQQKFLSFYSTKIDRKKIINHVASISNLVAAGATGYSLMLLPAATQELHEATNYLHQEITRQRNDFQALKDLDFFIQTNPHIIENIKKIRETTEKIEVMLKHYVPSPQQQYIPENNTFYAQSHYNYLKDLVKQKKDLEASVNEAMSPFFTKYIRADIETLANNNEKHIKQLERLGRISRGSELCSLPLAALPLAFRSLDDQAKANAVQATACGILLTMSSLFFLCALSVVEIPLPAQLVGGTSILLSTTAAYKNVETSSNLVEKIIQQRTNAQYVKEILDLRQGHRDNFTL